MSMQLNAPNAGRFRDLANFCSIRIDKNADGADLRWQRVENSADFSRLDVAWTFPIKVEPNHVGAEFNAGAGIIHICDTANFDLCRSRHGKSQTVGRLVGRVTP